MPDHLESIWAFQNKDAQPEVSSFDKIVRLELEGQGSLTESVEPFALLQVEMGEAPLDLLLEVHSEVPCLGLQVFFMAREAEGAHLARNDQHFRLSISGVGNDLLGNILQHDLSGPKHLGTRYRGFLEAAGEASGKFLTLWCPFWDRFRAVEHNFDFSLHPNGTDSQKEAALIESGDRLFEQIYSSQAAELEQRVLSLFAQAADFPEIHFHKKTAKDSEDITKVFLPEY